MKFRNTRSGFSIVEVVIAVVIIGLVGFLGYTFYNNQMNKTADNSSQAGNQSATASDVKSAPVINSTSDLDAAEAALDQTDPGGSNNTDASQLDTELARF
jgi:prepilin-type N-terminal cleavage/methylation domain-containing protein